MTLDIDNIATRKTSKDGSTLITWDDCDMHLQIFPRFSHSLSGSDKGETGGYLLFDIFPDEDGKIPVYVGESAQSGVLERIRRHDAKPPDKKISRWLYAIAVTGSPTDETRPSMDVIKEIELVLYRMFENKEYVSLVNKQKPSGGRLSSDELDMIRAATEAAWEVMRGYCDPSRKPKLPPAKFFGKNASKPANEGNGKHGQPEEDDGSDNGSSDPPPPKVTMADLVAAGILKIKDNLLGPMKKKGIVVRCRIIDSDGTIELLQTETTDGELVEDFQYRQIIGTSPSATPVFQAIGMKNPPNGWTFWRLDNYEQPKLSELQEQYRKSR